MSPCICKMAGCSNPRDCDEDFCEQHLIEKALQEKQMRQGRLIDVPAEELPKGGCEDGHCCSCSTDKNTDGVDSG